MTNKELLERLAVCDSNRITTNPKVVVGKSVIKDSFVVVTETLTRFNRSR